MKRSVLYNKVRLSELYRRWVNKMESNLGKCIVRIENDEEFID